MNIDSQTLGLINKFVKGKENLKFTIGCISGNNTLIKVFDSKGEIDTTQTIYYEIGSITKTFTSALLAKYVQEGKMMLNDSIKDYIQDLPDGQYYPTLKRLATHTSGYSALLPFNTLDFLKLIINTLANGGTKSNPLADLINTDEMKKVIRSKRLKDKDYPYAYSNFGYDVLGYILGTISKKGYWNAMNEFITHDLGLTDTCLGIVNDKNIHGFNRKNKDFGNWLWNSDDLLAPAGGMSSTAQDLLDYAKKNMYEQKPYLSLCHDKQADATKKMDMGLGWELQKGNNIICKDGATGCFTSFLGFDKNKKNAVVVLSNYTCYAISKIGLSMLGKLQCY
ncbi:D-alanyl-D-alanine-carboxypeptidase/endopeptidase AmpH [termite gut metagenome]|uniref:D-alanyl-D-alanine-carboxypeptidase/endopeptidase AmpH n=1 Tax=termite gut metagenome TaxID=433724 RepID=A0A5J4QDQ8_9ZZZZ